MQANSDIKSSIYQTLKTHWGYEEFRPLQEEIITSIMEGNDTMAILPTGGGKSICFQVPGLCMEGLTIVVSPLISLMKDQVENLKSKRINAYAIYSGMSKREIDIILDNCAYGDVKFLYLSPERLKTELFLERVKKMKPSLLVIDEAHCISEWGYDFRPSYLEISNFRELYPNIPVAAFTASATPKVEKDIIHKLNFKSEKSFKGSFERGHLSLSIRNSENKKADFLNLIRSTQGSMVVYANTRRTCKELAQILVASGESASFYHGGLENAERIKRQMAWINGSTRIMVATNAFGMGIDKADVRSVIHYEVPGSIEAYYQESGRAGRDRKPSTATLLFTKNDLDKKRIQFSLSFPSREDLQNTYQALSNYYQLAIGAGEMSTHSFEIRDFAKQYDFELPKAYNSLRTLERLGFITMNEAFFHPTRINILLDNHELYKFQISQPKYESLLKGLLRIYGGEAFESFVSIEEKRVAKILETTESNIKTGLRQLHQLKVIEYEPQNSSPSVTFLTPRQDVAKMPIDEGDLNSRKDREKDRLDAVEEFVTSAEKCRSQYLSEYFGEHGTERCSKCDVCIKLDASPPSQKEIERRLIFVVKKNGSIHQSELLKETFPFFREEVLQTLRVLLDEGVLKKNVLNEVSL